MSEHKMEGDLRAWLDGELAPAELASVEAHLGSCTDCAALRDRVAARAAGVAGALALLSLPAAMESAPRFAPRVLAMPAPARNVWRWAVPVAAIAAALAVGGFFLPRLGTATPVAAPVASGAAHAPKVDAPKAVPHLPDALAVARKPRLSPGAASKAAPKAAPSQNDAGETFLALDSDPIETGMVVRVSSESGNLQADVIVGPDGRAHAIRILNSGSDY